MSLHHVACKTRKQPGTSHVNAKGTAAEQRSASCRAGCVRSRLSSSAGTFRMKREQRSCSRAVSGCAIEPGSAALPSLSVLSGLQLRLAWAVQPAAAKLGTHCSLSLTAAGLDCLCGTPEVVDYLWRCTWRAQERVPRGCCRFWQKCAKAPAGEEGGGSFERFQVLAQRLVYR